MRMELLAEEGVGDLVGLTLIVGDMEELGVMVELRVLEVVGLGDAVRKLDSWTRGGGQLRRTERPRASSSPPSAVRAGM